MFEREDPVPRSSCCPDRRRKHSAIGFVPAQREPDLSLPGLPRLASDLERSAGLV